MVALVEQVPTVTYRKASLSGTIKVTGVAQPKKISDEVVLAPYNYILSLPHKAGWDKTMHALNVWYSVPAAKLERIHQVTTLIHNASLMLDDIQDGSQLRRGQPATHMVFGVGQTINSAGYAVHLGLTEITKWNCPRSLAIWSEEITQLYIGQGNDLHWTSNLVCPTEQEYWEMNDAKTGGMFRFFTRLMQIHATKNHSLDISNLLNNIGRHFQLRDDYLSLGSTEYTATKGFCEDLDEGKYSLPLIHLISARPNDYALRNMLVQRRVDGKQSLGNKHTILKLLKDNGSMDYSLEVIHSLQEKIDKEVSQIEETSGANPQIRMILKCLNV